MKRVLVQLLLLFISGISVAQNNDSNHKKFDRCSYLEWKQKKIFDNVREKYEFVKKDAELALLCKEKGYYCPSSLEKDGDEIMNEATAEFFMELVNFSREHGTEMAACKEKDKK